MTLRKRLNNYKFDIIIIVIFQTDMTQVLKYNTLYLFQTQLTDISDTIIMNDISDDIL